MLTCRVFERTLNPSRLQQGYTSGQRLTTNPKISLLCVDAISAIVKSCCLQVALRLVWYCLLSVLALVLVTAFAILHPVLLWAPQAALGKSLTATLPGLALIHISSVAMVIAAVCAALAEV